MAIPIDPNKRAVSSPQPVAAPPSPPRANEVAPARQDAPAFKADSFATTQRKAQTLQLKGEAKGVAPAPSKSAAQLFGLGGKNDRDKLIEATSDLRNLGTQVRSLQAEIARTPPGDPKYAQLQAQLKTTEGTLKSRYGYTAQTLPKQGSMWVDPQFLGKSLSNGKVTSSQFPTGTPVSSPPDPMTQAMHQGNLTVQTADGKSVTVHSAEEYRALVAQNRAATGMPVNGGDPIGAHLSFQGGGGKGKRYGAVLSEMYSQGVVPTSVSGASAGAIAASLVAAGATPSDVQRIVTDPQLGKLYDIDLGDVQGGAMDGNKAFDFIDQRLRELTGIKDRPVTFADLKVPLQIVATKMSDTNPAPGTGDLTQINNRIFVFSQETTPDTPVALAVRASMAIPAAFDPVQMVDPMTGRQVQLTDGGVLDNLPMNYNHDHLPNIGVSLGSEEDNNPANKTAQPKAMPAGNIDAGNIIQNGYWGYKMNQDSAVNTSDFKDRTQPKAGNFMLDVPTWDLTNPDKGDSTMGFGWDPKLDPKLDGQTRDVTRSFLRSFMDDFGKPGASGTNVTTQIPADLKFSVDVSARGKQYVASYSGGDKVHFQQKGGKESFDLSVGRNKIESMYLDGAAFNALGPELGQAANAQWSWWDQIRSGHFPQVHLPSIPGL